MSYVDDFITLLGKTLPIGMNAYALQLTENEQNPFILLSRHTNNEGGTMAIKSGILYVRAKEFNHPNASVLTF